MGADGKTKPRKMAVFNPAAEERKRLNLGGGRAGGPLFQWLRTRLYSKLYFSLILSLCWGIIRSNQEMPFNGRNLLRCMGLIEPLLVGLHTDWHEAHSLYHDRYPPEVLAEHDESTAASCVRAHMLMALKRRYDGVPGCHILDYNGLKVLNYRDLAVLRFKKVDAAGRHHNYQTGQQKDFDAQEPLPGLPPAGVRLTSGYQLDISGQTIERIIIARPLSSSIMWTAQVNVIEESAFWVDITPRRLAGTEGFDYRGRAGGRR